MFPLLVPAIGAVTALIGVFITKVKPGENALKAINRGFYIAATISAVLSAIAAYVYLPATFDGLHSGNAEISALSGSPRMVAVLAVLIGIVLAAIILWLTGYFTGTDKRPTKDVARTSLTGAATVVLSGIGVGLESAVYTAAIIGGAVYLAFLLGGSVALSLFLIALAGCGLPPRWASSWPWTPSARSRTTRRALPRCPVTSTARERRSLTDLDAVGNTTKAITKGIAIATAVLAATALFGSYSDAWQTELRRIINGNELTAEPSKYVQSMFDLVCRTPASSCGLLIGVAVVFLFSGPGDQRVTRAAGAIVFEVRRQFREIPGSWRGPRSRSTARSSTSAPRTRCASWPPPASWRPHALGRRLRPRHRRPGRFPRRRHRQRLLMAVFLANAGGSWDNAKKIVEDGHHGGKGSDAHAATLSVTPSVTRSRTPPARPSTR